MIAFQLLIVLVAAYQAFLAVRNPRELLSPVSVVAFGFSFVYVATYYAFPNNLRATYLNSTGYDILITLAFFSLAAFAIGFWQGRRRPYPPRGRRSLDHRRALHFSVLLLLVSFSLWSVFIESSGGFLHYYSSVHGHGGDWAKISAYIYSWQLFLFPATFILYLAYLDRQAKPWHQALLLLSLAYLFANAYLAGSRGGWLRLMIMLAVPRLFLRTRRRLSRRLVYLLVPGIMAIVLVTPYIRSYTTLGKQHHINLLNLATAILGSHQALVSSGGVTGNELAVASGLIAGASRTGTVNYGLDWLQPFINFIPRRLYPQKNHMPFYVDYWTLTSEGMGAPPAPGSSFTGLAGTYVEFSWLAPLAWFAFGWWGGLRYRAVLSHPNWVNGGYLAAYLIGLIYLVTQTFAAAFYGWFYFAAAIWGMVKWAGSGRRTRRTRRRRALASAVPTEGRDGASQGETG